MRTIATLSLILALPVLASSDRYAPKHHEHDSTQEQSQTQTSSQTAQGGVSSIEGDDVNVDVRTPKQYRNPGMLYLPSMSPTAPCIVPITAGISVPGGGGGLGRGKEDEDCTLRETVRMWHTIGEPDLAREIACYGDGVVRTIGTEACLNRLGPRGDSPSLGK